MQKERNALKAGLFIVVSVAVFLAIILSVSGASRLLGPSRERSVRFKLSDDISGLRVGDEVRVGGFKVGVVQSIDLTEPAAGQSAELLVRFTFPGKYTLREGARIGVQSQLAGPAVLNIDDLGAGNPLPEGVALVGNPDPKTALFASLGQAGPGVQSIVNDVKTNTMPRINKLVERIDGKIEPAVAKYENVADRTAEFMGEARDLIGDTKTDIRGTMSNLNAASGTVKDKLPKLMDRMNDAVAKVDDSLAKLQESLDDVKATMANARELTGSAKSVIVSNRGKLDGMIAGLKTTSDNLKGASAEIRRSPWRLLYKPGPGEMENLNLYDSARQFADGANALNDAATSLRDLLKSKDASPKEIEQRLQKLDETFSNFKDVEEKLWTSVKE